MEVKPARFQWVTQLPTLVMVGASIAILVLSPFWAIRWYRMPFLGMQLEPNNVVNAIHGEAWPAVDQGASFKDRLIALGGETVSSVDQVEHTLDQNGFQVIHAVFVTANGEEYSLEITPIRVPLADLISLFVVPYVVGFIFLGIGLWAYSLRSELLETRALVMFVSGVAILTSGFLDLGTTRNGVWVWSLALLVTAGGLVHLALVFPQPSSIIRRWPRIINWVWIFLGLLAPFMLYALIAPPSPFFYITSWQVGYLCIIIGFITLVAMLIWRMLRSQSPLVRQQSRVIVFGLLLALMPIILYLGSLAVGQVFNIPAWLVFPPMIIMPLSITYAILRFRLLDVDRILSRLLTYFLTLVIALGAFYALIALFSLLLEEVLEATDPLVIAGYLILLTVGLLPVRNFIQRLIDRLFYRSPADYRRALTSLSHELVITPDLNQTIQTISEQLQQALSPEKFVVYLYSDDLGEYLPEVLLAESTPSYQVEDPLINLLQRSESPIWLPPIGELPETLRSQPEKYRPLMGYTFVPLHYEEKLIGFLMLGPRRSGDLYTSDDLDFLNAVASQSTLALENARLFSNLKRTLDQTLEMKNLMSDIFASISTGVITTDMERKITLFNHAAEQILGIEAWQALGRSLSKALPGLGADLEDVTSSTLDDGAIVLSAELIRRVPVRGDVVLRLSCAPLRDAQLATKGATLVFEDLTERRHLEAEQERIRQTFGRVVAPRVRDRLLADPGNLRLDGTKQVVTTLFADVSGFTSYTEKRSPETVFRILNSYLSLAAQAILEEEGTLDKFMGDAVLAIWNSPDQQDDHVLRAVRAACAIRQRVLAAHREFPESDQHMLFRVGITTGPAIIGNVGTSELFNYTAIGDTVNLAQRLQAAAEPGQILLHKNSYDIVVEHINAKLLKPLKVKGREQSAEVFELIGLKEG